MAKSKRCEDRFEARDEARKKLRQEPPFHLSIVPFTEADKARLDSDEAERLLGACLTLVRIAANDLETVRDACDLIEGEWPAFLGAQLRTAMNELREELASCQLGI